MSLVVNTNIASMNAQRSLAANTNAMKMAMERLSTGRKINSSADDAAGFAIAETMTSQVRGLSMAAKNAGDALGMLNVIENATNDVTEMLQRVRELAVQAKSGTNSTGDIANLQMEADALFKEINRVSADTTYNDVAYLGAGATGDINIQVGYNDGDVTKLKTYNIAAANLGSGQVDTVLDTGGTGNYNGDTVVSDGTTTITLDHSVTPPNNDQDIAAQIQADANYANLLFTVSAPGPSSLVFTWKNAGGVATFSAAGAAGTDVRTVTNVTAAKTLSTSGAAEIPGVAQIDTVLDTGGTGNYNGDTVVSDGTTTITLDHSVTPPNNDQDIAAQIQADANYANLLFTVSAPGLSSLVFTWKNAGVPSGVATFSAAGAAGTDARTVTNVTAGVNVTAAVPEVYLAIESTDALDTITKAIEQVSGYKAEWGASQNRLEYTVSNVMNVVEFTSAARSRIRDADFALEAANLAKAQVLQQTGVEMLAQANASPQLVLQLVK